METFRGRKVKISCKVQYGIRTVMHLERCGLLLCRTLYLQHVQSIDYTQGQGAIGARVVRTKRDPAYWLLVHTAYYD